MGRPDIRGVFYNRHYSNSPVDLRNGSTVNPQLRINERQSNIFWQKRHKEIRKKRLLYNPPSISVYYLVTLIFGLRKSYNPGVIHQTLQYLIRFYHLIKGLAGWECSLANICTTAKKPTAKFICFHNSEKGSVAKLKSDTVHSLLTSSFYFAVKRAFG